MRRPREFVAVNLCKKFKIFVDIYNHFIYNIHIMKKDKNKFNINRWREERMRVYKFRKECVIFMLKHPITWFVLIVIVAYGSEALR